MDWFLYDMDLRRERVNPFQTNVSFLYPLKKQKTIGIEMGIEIRGYI